MQGNRKIIWSVAASTALLAGISTISSAQQRELFHWSGRVDQEVQLTMSGRSLTTSNLGPSEPGQRGANVVSALPRVDGQVSVQLVTGRGSVDVIRQPTEENGYTAIIRIRDPQGGADNYRLNAYWQPVAAGEVGPPFGRADGRARGGRVALQWNGEVDDNLLITLRPRGVSYRTVSGSDPRAIESSFNGLPSGVTNIDVNVRDGRGQVFVVQQPTPANGYTAVLRVRDPQPGYGHYSFDVLWQ
jgi:hypothetical protein